MIYSSVANLDAFARKKITSINTCYKSTPDKAGASSADVCCTIFSSNGQLLYSLCQKCNYGSDGNKIDCRNYTPRAGETGAVNPPLSAGTEQPPPSPPPLHPVPLPSAGVEKPSTSQQKTCPDGSTPDANGKCLSSPLGKLGGSTSNDNNPPSDHHKSKHSGDSGGGNNNNK